MADDSTASNKNDDFRNSLGRFTIPPMVNDPEERPKKWGLPESDTESGDCLIELNLLFEGGMTLAIRQFRELYKEALGESESLDRPPVFISKSYYKCSISVDEIRTLVARDGGPPSGAHNDIVHPEIAWAALLAQKITVVP